MQVTVKGGRGVVPEPSSVTVTWGAWLIVIEPPEAVNGPTVDGAEGADNVRPDAGTGLGMGTLKLIAPDVRDEGVAPLASSVVVTVPLIEFPSAVAKETTLGGITSWV